MGLGIKVTEWNANYSLNEMEFPPRSQLSNDLATGFGKKKNVKKLEDEFYSFWAVWFLSNRPSWSGADDFDQLRPLSMARSSGHFIWSDRLQLTMSDGHFPVFSLSATKYLVFCLIFEVNAFKVDYFLLMKTTNFFQGNIFLKMATWLFKWSDHFSKTL